MELYSYIKLLQHNYHLRVLPPQQHQHYLMRNPLLPLFDSFPKLKRAACPQIHLSVHQSVFSPIPYAAEISRKYFKGKVNITNNGYTMQTRKQTLVFPAAYVLPASFSCSELFGVGRGGGTHLLENKYCITYKIQQRQLYNKGVTNPQNV